MTDRLTRPVIKVIKAEIDAALAQIASRYGLDSLKTTTASFTRESFSVKIEGVVQGGKGVAAIKYERFQSRLGLPPFGASFEYRGIAYKIDGLNRTATKVLAVSERDGRRFRFPLSYVTGNVPMTSARSRQRLAPAQTAARSNRMGFVAPTRPSEPEPPQAKGQFAIDL